MQLTDEPLLFDAATQIVDIDGTVTLWVHEDQFLEDPVGVFGEMRDHLRINSRAYQRPSAVRLIHPRPASDRTTEAV